MLRNTHRTTIDVTELQSMLAAHQPLIVLDVRKSADRAEWAIPGSLHVDAYDALKAGVPNALASMKFPGNWPVVTVCAEGQTSLIAMEHLRARGYDARSLTGGMRAWSMAWNTAAVAVPGSAATVIQVRRTGKGCLSYLIGSNGEAAVIDASLPPNVYECLAEQRGWAISHVLDTHIHADHLSRSRLLAEATGATLHLPAQDRVAFPHAPVHEGDSLAIGTATIVAMRTPGHTLESTAYLLDDRALFTGDTLFINGVGRPDLEASAGEARERARLLHASLKQIVALPPETLILPGHANQPVPFDGVPVAVPLGVATDQIALLALPVFAFLEVILDRLPPTPPNHAEIVALNEAGAMPVGDLAELEAGANRCAVS